MLENGLLKLTNWSGDVIMPTLAGLFFAEAIYRFSKAHLSWAGSAALMFRPDSSLQRQSSSNGFLDHATTA